MPAPDAELPEVTLQTPLQLRPVVLAGRLLLGVVILHGAFAAAVYGRLPGRLPVHFGAGGAPDAWAAPGLGSWFFLPLLSAGVAALLGAVSLALFRVPPKWLNLPRKAAFLALGVGERRAVLGVVSAFTLLLGAILCATLLGIQVAQALVALGAAAAFPVAVPFAGLGAMFLVVIAMTVRTASAIDSAVAKKTRKAR